MLIDVSQLEASYRLSIPWIEPPKFSIGDRLFSNFLNLEKLAIGTLFVDGYWFYVVRHGGRFVRVREDNCRLLDSPPAPFPYNAFGLGDICKCSKKGINKSLILGLSHANQWIYFLPDNNNKIIAVPSGEVEKP